MPCNFSILKAPTTGTAITRKNGRLVVPDDPIIPFIEGDGTGPDIWRASVRVFDAAVAEGLRRQAQDRVDGGATPARRASSSSTTGCRTTRVEAFREYLVGIKGPLTTPVGGGIRSLNVALRQMLDLYVCLRPVRWFKGVPSPVKHPEKVDMVIFRENTEDIYAGIEFAAGTPEAQKSRFFASEFPKEFKRSASDREASSGRRSKIGASTRVDVRSASASSRSAARHGAADPQRHRATPSRNKRKSVTLVHKGNIMKFTEGAFRDWGYEVAKQFFGAVEIDGGPWCRIPDGKPGAGIVIKDAIADITLQQVLTRPDEFDVIATPNLNGDYLSDALAAQVGGIGIAPGGNINYVTGHAVFEATHGTAPKYANQDKVNPGSVILSGEMMLRYLGWPEAADLVVKGMDGAIAAKTVTYDFARLMEGATEVKTSEFADAIIANM